MKAKVTRALVGAAAASLRSAFLPPLRATMRVRCFRRNLGGVSDSSNPDSTNNDINHSDSDPVSLSRLKSASLLRNAILSSANGTNVRLGDRMGTDTSIVVFLRHLA